MRTAQMKKEDILTDKQIEELAIEFLNSLDRPNYKCPRCENSLIRTNSEIYSKWIWICSETVSCKYQTDDINSIPKIYLAE